MPVSVLEYQCNPRPDVTKAPTRGQITKMLTHRQVCTHCGRVYYADDMVTPGTDRPCPTLLRRALAEAKEEVISLQIREAERNGDLRYVVP